MTGSSPLRRRTTTRVLPTIVASGLALAGSIFSIQMSAAGSVDAGGTGCEDLAAFAFPNTDVTDARVVPAGDYVDLDGQRHRDLPEFCRVAATVAPSLTFEVWMPAATWNERFLGVGNGGFAGTINYSDMASALARGYATASTDTGHSSQDTTNSWISDPVQLEMWGRTSIHLMTERAKALITEYKAQAPRYSYYEGGSTGGRQGMDEAQFFPDDYDGIVSHSPGMDYSHVMMAVLWNAQRIVETPDGVLRAADRKLVHDAVLNACGGRDGVAGDPFLNDPRDCNFKVKALACSPSQRDACLTAEQVRTAEHVYSAVTNTRTGEHLYPGYAYGSESAWALAAEDPRLTSYPQPLFGRAVFDDPAWDWRTFDWDADVALVEEKLSPKIDPTRTDLSAFAASGGKLIMTQGWADPLQSGSLPIEYYTRVLLEHGGPKLRPALHELQDFYRLFMIPGGGHVRGGVGPNSIDALTALRAWVEQGVAPEEIVATKFVDDRPENDVVMTRPLCPYPQVARYDGSGSTDDAANFRCEEDWSDFVRDVAAERHRMLVREKRS
jgi:feruloyl esterase